MSNIIWKQGNGKIAVTSIIDGTSPEDHLDTLAERGDIPAGWEVLTTNYTGTYPSIPQEGWLWDDTGLIADPSYLPDIRVTPYQIRAALTQVGLRSAVEAAVAAGDQTLKDAWQYAQEFIRTDALVISLGTALGKTPEELTAVFELAATLKP